MTVHYSFAIGIKYELRCLHTTFRYSKNNNNINTITRANNNNHSKNNNIVILPIITVHCSFAIGIK